MGRLNKPTHSLFLYFNRFRSTFPELTKLNIASLDHVLRIKKTKLTVSRNTLKQGLPKHWTRPEPSRITFSIQRHLTFQQCQTHRPSGPHHQITCEEAGRLPY